MSKYYIAIPTNKNIEENELEIYNKFFETKIPNAKPKYFQYVEQFKTFCFILMSSTVLDIHSLKNDNFIILPAIDIYSIYCSKII